MSCNEPLINAALATHKEVSSYFKQVCSLVKSKRSKSSGSANEILATSLLLFCHNNQEALQRHLENNSGSPSGHYVQTIVEKLVDVIDQRDVSSSNKATAIYIVTKLQPNHWDYYGMAKRSESNSSLSFGMFGFKSPSLLDLSRRTNRAHTNPDEMLAASKDFPKLSIGIFPWKNHKSSPHKASGVKHSLSTDANGNFESTKPVYLLEMLKEFMQPGENPGDSQNPDIGSLILITKLLLEKGQGPRVLQLLEENKVFDFMNEFFSKTYAELDDFSNHFQQQEASLLDDKSTDVTYDIIELGASLTLYFQLSTNNDDLTFELLACDTACFEQISMNLYPQAVNWLHEQDAKILTASQKIGEKMAILKMASSLIIFIVEHVNYVFLEREIMSKDGMADIQESDDKVTDLDFSEEKDDENNNDDVDDDCDVENSNDSIVNDTPVLSEP